MTHTQTRESIGFGTFTMRILNATAIAIVVALIPNAVLGGLFSHLGKTIPFFQLAAGACRDIQWLVAPMIGFLSGLQFKLNPMRSAIIASASWIAAGAVKITAQGTYQVGLGDLINVMLFTAIAVYVTLLLGDKLGSLTIVLQPILVGAGVGLVGLFCLPYVSRISAWIGSGINAFTNLQPVLMCILIAMSFGVLIVSPISTVAIGLAIGLAGLSSGAANLGVAATASVLVVGSFFTNKAGVTLAVGLGGMKMMMPNLVRHPIMLLPILITSACTGLAGRLFGITGDKVSAGFGYVGLVGPIKAFGELTQAGASSASALVSVIVPYFVVTFGVAILCHILFTRILKLYSREIYRFESAS